MSSIKFPATTSFEPEKLEQLTYERSKYWAGFFKDVEASAKHESEEIAIEDLEVALAGIDKNEAWSSVDEAEESDVADDYGVRQDIVNWSLAHGKKLSRGACYSNSFREDSEVMEILNQTLPIVQEHERKWKEAGLNRALDTFDPDIIEKEVGGWLRRNRSAISETTQIQDKPHNDTDTDSLHSGDTARYIRASRNRIAKAKRRVDCTVSIKSFRKKQKLRKELYEEYTSSHCSCRKGPIPPKAWHSMCGSDVTNSSKDSNINNTSASSSEDEGEGRQRRCLRKLKLLPNDDHQTPKKNQNISNSFIVEMHLSSAITCTDKRKLDAKECGKSGNKIKKLRKKQRAASEENKQKKRVSRTRLKVLPLEPNDTTDSENSFQTKYPTKLNKQLLKMKQNSEIKKLETRQDERGAIKFPSKGKKKRKVLENYAPSESEEKYEKELALAIALSKKTFQKQQKKAALKLSDDNLATSKRLSNEINTPSTNTSCSTDSFEYKPKQSKYRRLLANNELGRVKDSFFLNVTKNICNSTALKDDSAVKRQFCVLPSIEESSVCAATTAKLCQQPITFGNTVERKVVELGQTIDSTPKAISKAKAVSTKENGNDSLTTPEKVNLSEEQIKNSQVNMQTPPKSVGIGAKPVLVYTPQHKHLAPDGYFSINQENLSPVLGKKLANKLTKYHIGPRRFPSSSVVYYYPPNSLPSSDTTSDEDELERFGLYGEFHESPQTGAAQSK